MRRRYNIPGKPEMIRRQRLALIFVGSVLLCLGIGALLRGNLHYQNWWGAPVFATFAIVIAILAFAAAFKCRSDERQSFK